MAPDGCPAGTAGYAYQEHTADLRLVGWGPSPAEAIRQVLLALVAMLAPPPSRRPAARLAVTVCIEAPDLVSAMVQAANDLLYRLDADALVPLDVSAQLYPARSGLPAPQAGDPASPRCPAEAAGPVRLRLELAGMDAMLAGYEPSGAVPKAATYHEAAVECDAATGNDKSRRWQARLTVDL